MLVLVRGDGLPVPDYNDTLEDFDSDVIDALERDEDGVVVLIETFAAKRTYYSYGNGRRPVADALEELRAKYPQHQMHAFERADEDWELLARYRARWAW
jgi:hypothetical protein